MNVSEIMTRDVVVARPNDTLQQAARKMRDENFGSMPVCDGKRLQGMITDRDITIRAVADGMDTAATRCSDIMTGEVSYVFDDDTVEAAAKVMIGQQIRRLPIVDREKNLVGIVALGDIAIHTRDDDRKGAALEGISQPA